MYVQRGFVRWKWNSFQLNEHTDKQTGGGVHVVVRVSVHGEGSACGGLVRKGISLFFPSLPSP